MPSAKSTTKYLVLLRGLMENNKYVQEPIQAYIVPSNDAHNSEYLADCDKFRAFLTGFNGSEGTAIVTQSEACLWTDGRYFLQASQQLDSNWQLMKEGLPATPSQGTWLSTTLSPGSKIGVDPQLFTYKKYSDLKAQLETVGHKIVPVASNLIKEIWTDRPAVPSNPIKPLALFYTGKTIADKLELIHLEMQKAKASYLILTALDEIAYFLNLRGSDIQYNPVFFAYILITRTSYTLYINKVQATAEVKAHLDDQSGKYKYTIASYESLVENLTELATLKNNQVFWCSEFASFAITSLIPCKRILIESTPIALMKAIKNSAEIQGMRNAHIKDAAALCCYFAWLEKNVGKMEITEISAAKRLEEFRKEQDDFVGPSFDTISSVGAHGAIIHYKPEPSTDEPLTNTSLYLCDSGGQYRDGTTDVTRTLHFGTPTHFERECYTRVLKGQLKLARAIFPRKIKGNYLDSFAREYLWQVGLDYAHGTGHGIGSYLNVHEGPMEISWRTTQNDPGLEAGMFVSNEPGYYKDGEFGIRIEDIVQIVKADTKHNDFGGRGFLTFETVTMVPKQTKLVDVELLSLDEVEYLNGYHQKCRELVGPLLEKQGKVEAKEWLWRETESICK